MHDGIVTVLWNGQTLRVPRGTRLSDAIRAESPCGGHGRCGKCRVIANGALSPVTDAERRHLSAEELARGVRLACIATVEGDAVVTRLSEEHTQILSDGIDVKHGKSTLFSRYGAAIDVGTTTLAAKLFRADGSEIAACSRLNPQSAFGADVISRIEAALRGEGSALATVIREALCGMLCALAADAGIGTDEIERVVITGNTAMLYFFTETSPYPLSRAPFKADRRFGETLSAESAGLSCLSPETPVVLPPCISAFVGADTVCALLAADMPRTGKTLLLTDIGTNGEMALSCGEDLFVCSTAAGPAFEGVGISMGMRGADGAIDAVTVINGALHAHTIGGKAPIGICGSGLVDAVACLLDVEELDETGLLEDDAAVIGAPVVLTQKDVRAVQLAKSAICAGMETLFCHRGISVRQIDAFYLAGGFGSYLHLGNAERIGLIPEGLAPRAEVIGNAALSGAAMLLFDAEAFMRCVGIQKRAQVVDLATNKTFADKFMNGMLFSGG